MKHSDFIKTFRKWFEEADKQEKGTYSPDYTWAGKHWTDFIESLTLHIAGRDYIIYNGKAYMQSTGDVDYLICKYKNIDKMKAKIAKIKRQAERAEIFLQQID